MSSYILGVDVWEGQLEIDEPVLKAAGVAFMIIRLNDMNGGHHMDQGFTSQWEQAAGFIRFPYFVYNPWVDGAENFAWMKNHLPADVKRIAIDVEVVKDGYSPKAYSDQLASFLGFVKSAGLKPVIYTGAWFLPYLSRWPSDCEYWWARYPYLTYPANTTHISWEDLKLLTGQLRWTDWTKGAPGPVALWQCSGDRYILPGTTRPLDINLWSGTVEELAAWMGQTAPEPVKTFDQHIYEWASNLPIYPYTGPGPE